ncbi:hypothetical protein [Pseudoramibacter sp.]|jgi:hypothetical protein|uniref:hypothetical protein n=1 Tax=Pseudoramibacter sp. TaxID=2034862 RepID=UPI0025D4EEFE|nr:hypothetical protein [Pseudoramibacter sp.]MCH4072666.1 hypothetical protein [Pseudoramibacter sp.]MCH4106437.1 hypothetical protein [Pseudoramibacter sp.]
MKKAQPELKLLKGQAQEGMLSEEAQRHFHQKLHMYLDQMQDLTKTEEAREAAKEDLFQWIQEEERKIQRIFEKGDEEASQLQWQIALASRDHVPIEEGFLYRQMERIRFNNESAQWLLEQLGKARWMASRWERAHLASAH